MQFTLNFAKFIDLGYWLNPTPPTGQIFFITLATLLTLKLLILGWLAWFLSKKYFKDNLPKKRVLSWVSTTFFSFVPVALLLLFFRLAGIGFVSIRILWPIIFVIIIGINIYYLYYFFKIVPKQINKLETIKLKQKYFRHRKR